MSAAHPPWIAKDLAAVLGLDLETVKQVIIPDLETYTHEVRLRSHLQDFLGSTPSAKTFTDRYLKHRFPNLLNTAGASTPPIVSQWDKPPVNKTTTASQTSKKAKSGSSTPSGGLSTEALNSAFGPGGKIYQKNRDADGWGGSPSGSGSQTPGIQFRTPLPVSRPGGAMTIKTKAETKSQKQKEQEKIWDIPKSKEVKRLESLIEDLEKMKIGEGKTASEEAVFECFCQGDYSGQLCFELTTERSSESPAIDVHATLCTLRSSDLHDTETKHPMPVLHTSTVVPCTVVSPDHASRGGYRQAARGGTKQKRRD
ncbi:hypothetical protein P7C73_g2379, partial [Tremellales sp. Uapishka_1]